MQIFLDCEMESALVFEIDGYYTTGKPKHNIKLEDLLTLQNRTRLLDCEQAARWKILKLVLGNRLKPSTPYNR